MRLMIDLSRVEWEQLTNLAKRDYRDLRHEAEALLIGMMRCEIGIRRVFNLTDAQEQQREIEEVTA
jgi:hypothetical protein